LWNIFEAWLTHNKPLLNAVRTKVATNVELASVVATSTFNTSPKPNPPTFRPAISTTTRRSFPLRLARIVKNGKNGAQ